jgi:ketosteroid isomerase-like protein
LTDNELRRQNETILRRFTAAEGGSDERRKIWAEDAIFELPLQGLVFRGRDAILARGRDSDGKYRDSCVVDLMIYPMLDPNVFLVTHGLEETSVATGARERNQYASIFELRDGRIVRRIEYHAFG